MEKKGISLGMLIAIVISSSIGTAIFTFANNLASVAAPGPILIAWIIVGIGVLALALSFSNLLHKQPELNGIFAYAQAGFGEFAGFLSGWGYWLSAWLGNVALATIMVSAIGYFIPMFRSGQNIASIILASVISWSLTYFISRGVESATMVNTVVTVCKLIPLFVFIIVAVILFKGHLFSSQFWGNVDNNFSGKVAWSQIKKCIMVMMWSFVGVEGATMMASRARVKSDASKATIIGVITLVLLYGFVSLLPYGYFNQAQLVKFSQPALVYLFNDMVGPIGGTFISLGLIISIFGAWISWTMLPAETVLLMSKANLLPAYFAKINHKQAPHVALFITQILVQFFLVTLIFTKQAYNLAAALCTASIVITYSFVAAFQIKHSLKHLTQKGEKYQLIIGVIALGFQLMGIMLAGVQYLLMATVAYVPGLFFYWQAQKVKNKSFKIKWYELLIMILIICCAVIMIVSIMKGDLHV